MFDAILRWFLAASLISERIPSKAYAWLAAAGPAIQNIALQTHLLNTGAIVFLEASFNLHGSRIDVAQTLTIEILSFSSHARNGQDLLVLLHALLELAKEDSQTCRRVSASRQTG